MPYRPIQHQISSRAVAKVRDVWASIGAAVEEVRQDYGEDLLVQTCLNGKMDAARIWVQVKGVASTTNMSRPDDKTPIRVRADQALRWARSADILLLVFWDVEGNRGWYSIPQLGDMYLHSSLVEKERQYVELYVPADQPFNAESAQAIAWEARLEHLSRFVRSLRRLEEESVNEPEQAHWAVDAIVTALIDMMSDLNMIERVSEPSRRYVLGEDFRACMLEVNDGTSFPPSADWKEYTGRLITRSIVRWITIVTGNGIDFTLVLEMLNAINAIGNFDDALD